MQHVDDPSSITWFPIRLLHACIAVRYVSPPRGRREKERGKFRSLDDSEELADTNPSKYPPLFVCVLERKGAKNDIAKDCHVFICKDVTSIRTWVMVCL